jgi:hypothetical protein
MMLVSVNIQLLTRLLLTDWASEPLEQSRTNEESFDTQASLQEFNLARKSGRFIR